MALSFSKAVGYFLAILIPAGVITTVLVILMVPSTSNKSEHSTTTMEGNFVYVEIPGQGKVKGRRSAQETAIFAGIPFGLPPMGEYRWQKPRPVSTLDSGESYYDATYARPGCAQLCTLPSAQYVCPSEISEDCLHLAIYVPKRLTKTITTDEGEYFTLIDNIKSSMLPVMVFFYGGAYIAGANGVALYDARFLAEKGDVITVVPNYRLGPFGFFYQNSENSEAALGNFGIWDQIEALKWVQKNIYAFGGNSNQVTIFGQSAGAQSVAAHLVSNYSDPYFHRAILESNPFGITYKTREEAQNLSNSFVQSCSDCRVNDMACIRALSMTKMLQCLEDFPPKYQFNPNSLSQLFEPWSPIIDYDLLQDHPYYLFYDEKNQKKPLIHGTAKDEGMFFVIQILADPNQSNIIYDTLLELMFGKSMTEVKDHYPPTCPSRPLPPMGCDNREAMDDIVTDYMFVCPSRRVFNVPSRYGDPNLPVWWYMFNQTWSFPQFWENYTACYNLSCHSAELPFVFDVDTLTEYRFTPEELVLSNTMIKYWTNFAKYGDPNGINPLLKSDREVGDSRELHDLSNYLQEEEVPFWPRVYEGEGSAETLVYKTLQFTASGPYVMEDFSKHNCDFFDDLDLYLNDSIRLGEAKVKEIIGIA